MKNLLLLSVCLLVTGCANNPNPATSSNQSLPGKAAPQSPIYERIKIGMPRQEAEQILGEPASVTDTAEGTTSVWVYGQNASNNDTPQNTANDGQMIGTIGNIAATAAGIFIPYAGLATSIGSQVYSLSNSSGGSSQQSAARTNKNTLVVTVEFKDNKVFSIQHAHPIATQAPK